MKVAVIGAGMMGSTIAWDLARSEDVDSVLVGDMDDARLEEVRRRCGKRVKTDRLDVSHSPSLNGFMRDRDVVISALPHGVIHPVDLAAMRSGAKLVNIAFEDEQMEMNDIARKNGALLIPGAGLAPGLSAILAAEGARELRDPYEGHILVGGLPQKPLPPLKYRLVFSVKGLIREYLSARVIRAGKVEDVVPFDVIEHHRFPKPIGLLEAFYTDGLGSALYTMRNLSILDEKTLRWPGHGEKIRFLRDSGFFSGEEVEVAGTRLAPIDFTSRLLYRLLNRGDPKDVTVMRVDVLGTSKGKGRKKVRFEMIDYYDDEKAITSMGRTTGFTAAIIARMVGRGELAGRGVLGPESVLDRPKVAKLVRELAGKGVKIIRRTRPIGRGD